jgi:hypothetical protein
MQSVVAILIVLACVAYVGWQLLRTIRSGNGKAGACCSKGCGGEEVEPAPSGTRTQFISADSLRRKRI